MPQPANRKIFTQPLPPLPTFTGNSEKRRSEKDVTRFFLIIAISTFAEGILYLSTLSFLDISEEARQSIGFAGLIFLLLGVAALILHARKFKDNYTGKLTTIAIFSGISLLIGALVSADVPVLGIVALLTFFLIANYFFSGEKTVRFIVIGMVTAILTVLANVFSPFEQFDGTIFRAYWGVLFIIEVGLIIYYISIGSMARFLQMRVFFTFITVAIIPLVLLSIFSRVIQQNLIENNNRALSELAANEQAEIVNTFIESNLNNLEKQAQLEIFQEFLDLPELKRNASPERLELDETIRILSQSSEQIFLKSYGVLDNSGTVVYDSYGPAIGANEAEEEYYKYSFNFQQPFFSSVRFLIYPYDAAEVIFSAPIVNAEDETIGIVRARYNADVFQDLLRPQELSSGDKSYTVLVDENGLRLADNSNREALYQPISPLPDYARTTLQIENRIPNSFRPENAIYNGAISDAIEEYKFEQYFEGDFKDDNQLDNEIAYIARIDKMPWFLVYIQEQIIASEIAERQADIITLAITFFVTLTGVFAILSARLISRPILKLTQAASQVSKGNLEVETHIRSKDEIGTLAVVFNSMTRRLRTIISELEERVAARTQELAEQNASLAHRSQQLTTIADVARSIVAEQDLETLLSQVANLISKRFDFYHVGIFLVDPAGQYAVLRAANSEGGKRMLARQHKLRVGQVGIVGYATGAGQARIATDVGEDAIYFNNPDLPNTRSEMALPLKDGENVIGALDVQSLKPDAFSTEDIELFNTLADQVAVAIVNSRLYEETQQALKEMQETHRQYLRQSWKETIEESDRLSYRYSLKGLTASEPLPTEDLLPVIETNDAITPDEDTLQLPINLRGETIGVIQIQKPENNREWNETQISTIERVTEQIALALENARLFEETTKRAERDRKVLEITSKIRSTTDFNEMLEIAVNELKRELNASGAQVVLQKNEFPAENLDAPANNGHKPQ